MLELLWLASLSFAASTPANIPNPRASNAWVSDTAGVIAADEEARMNARLDALHGDTDAEVAVVTVKDVAGTPKDFTTRLFNLWGVGDARTNKGLLVVLVMDQRRVEMETGYGLEAQLPDGWLGIMQAREMVPAFKSGDYGRGLAQGIAAVDARIREGGPPPASAGSKPRSSAGSGGDSGAMRVLGALALLAFLGALGRVIFVLVRSWRDKRCPSCKQTMLLLDEEDDDAHLDEGQQSEEMVQSVNWLVYVCAPCEFVRVTPRPKFFTRYEPCPECDHRTAFKNSTTLRVATESRGGRVRVHRSCMHCTYDRISHHSTPRISSDTGSGGSSGGGSFGGGSSGGGGAGSSW